MDVFAWICAVALAATFLIVGVMKLVVPREKLISMRSFGWAADWSSRDIRGIGLAETLGAIGVIVPWATGIAPVLTPIAAVGLTLIQVGAFRTHWRRGEKREAWGNVSLLSLAVVVAVIRFVQL